MDLPLSESGTLLADLPCTQCGYSLRTKQPAEKCPECGHGVRESMDAAKYVTVPPRWLGWQVAALAGLAIASVASGLQIILAIVSRRAWHFQIGFAMRNVEAIALGWMIVCWIFSGRRQDGWLIRSLSWTALGFCIYSRMPIGRADISKHNLTMAIFCLASFVLHAAPWAAACRGLRTIDRAPIPKTPATWIILALIGQILSMLPQHIVGMYFYLSGESFGFFLTHSSRFSLLGNLTGVLGLACAFALVFLSTRMLLRLRAARRLSLAHHASRNTLPPPLEGHRAVKGGLLALIVLVGSSLFAGFCAKVSAAPSWMSENVWDWLVRIGMTCLILLSFALSIRAFRFGYQRMP